MKLLAFSLALLLSVTKQFDIAQLTNESRKRPVYFRIKILI